MSNITPVTPHNFLTKAYDIGREITVQEFFKTQFSKTGEAEDYCFHVSLGVLKKAEMVTVEDKLVRVTTKASTLLNERTNRGFTYMFVLMKMATGTKLVRGYKLKEVVALVSPSNLSSKMESLIYEDLLYLYGRGLVVCEGDTYLLPQIVKDLFTNFYHPKEEVPDPTPVDSNNQENTTNESDSTSSPTLPKQEHQGQNAKRPRVLDDNDTNDNDFQNQISDLSDSQTGDKKNDSSPPPNITDGGKGAPVTPGSGKEKDNNCWVVQ